jgi:DNA polymerase I-like protein with 3'-5' exonuclease and polymerase domains
MNIQSNCNPVDICIVYVYEYPPNPDGDLLKGRDFETIRDIQNTVGGSFNNYGFASLFPEPTPPSIGFEKIVEEHLLELSVAIRQLPNLKMVVSLGSYVSEKIQGLKFDICKGKILTEGALFSMATYAPYDILADSSLIQDFVRDIITAAKVSSDNLFLGIPVVSGTSTYLQEHLSGIRSADILAYDTETSSLDPFSEETYIIGVSLCWSDNDACFVALDHDDLVISSVELSQRLEILKTILEDKAIPKVAQNGKFDRLMLSQVLGIRVQGDIADTMLDAHLIDELSSHSLSSMTDRYLVEYCGYDAEMNATMTSNKHDMTAIPLSKIVGYACGDAFATYKLHHIFERLLQQDDLLDFARTVILPANLAYTEMEEAGVRLDIPLMKEYIPLYKERVEELQRTIGETQIVKDWEQCRLRSFGIAELQEELIHGLATGRFSNAKNATPFRITALQKKIRKLQESAVYNPSSPPQTIKLYYEFGGLPVQFKYGKNARTKRKESKPSAGKEAREALLLLDEEKYAYALEVVKVMTEYAKMSKLYTGFLCDFTKHIRDDGLVHTTFSQAVTKTGRLSNSQPNLQQVPKLTKAGEDAPEYEQWMAKNNIKKAYISKFTDGLIINADYSQLELRLMACLSNDEIMVNAYRSGSDLHEQTARLMFPDYDRVSIETRAKYRNKGKTKNFASVYAMSRDFLNLYPGLKAWVETTIEYANTHYETYNPFNRKRRLLGLKTIRDEQERRNLHKQGVNAVIQSTGHDMLMRALVRVRAAFKAAGLRSHLIFEVHDSIVVDCYAPEKMEVARILKTEMENIDGLDWITVPIIVDVEGGKTWGTLEPIVVS